MQLINIDNTYGAGMPVEMPSAVQVNFDKIILTLILCAGAILQGLYLHLFQLIPIASWIKMTTVAMAIYSALMLINNWPGRGMFRAFSKSFAVTWIALLYGLLLSLSYKGDDVLSYLDPIIALLTFFIVLFFIAFFGNGLRHVVTGLVVCCLIIASAHLLNSNFQDYSLGIGATSLRYGYIDGKNIINLTGQNLVYLMLASYLIFRFARASKWLLLGSGFAAILFVPAVLASGSRAAYLTALIVIGVSEWSMFSRQFSVRRLAPVVGLVVFAVYCASEYSEIFHYAYDRISLFRGLSEGRDLAVGVRMEGVWTALDLDSGLMFGTGLSGDEFLRRSADNTIASLIIGFGLVGLSIVILGVYLVASEFVRATRIGSRGLIFLLAPLVMRALAEGTFFSKSSLFPAIIYFIAVYLAFSRASVAVSFGEGSSRRGMTRFSRNANAFPI